VVSADAPPDELNAARRAFWQRVPNGAAGDDPPLPLVMARNIGRDLQAPAQIIEDLLCAGDLAEMYGDAGAGKSTTALYAATCVATGRTFLGRRVVACAALYLAPEAAGVRQRLHALMRHNEIDDMPLALVPASVDLHDGLRDVDRVIDAARTLEARSGFPIGLIVVDTFARAIGTADENVSRDVGAVMNHLQHIADSTGAAVLVIHHSGKDSTRGSRGSSAIRAAVDLEIEVTQDESLGVRVLTVRKARNLAATGDRLAVKFLQVDIGVDQWGKPLIAAVAEPADLPDAVPAERPMPSGSNQRIAAEALAAPLRESKTFGRGGAPPLWPCLDLEQAVQIVAAQLTCEDKRRIERARTAIGGLVARGVFGSKDGFVWRK
jgi:hypothetical protein